MSHKDYKDVEDFLVDDTFQQFCSEENEQCVAYWKSYMLQHPEQHEIINRAKRLYHILTGNKSPKNEQIAKLRSELIGKKETSTKRLWHKPSSWLKVAAVAAVFGFAYYTYHINKIIIDMPIEMQAVQQTYQTNKGEKKTITLEDGTVITLNSASKLRVDENFGKSNRQVFLEGEAYLDVKKDKDKPFVLHTNEFDIRVLGTSFNVKSYPDELASEALLIEGLIELKSKGKNENSMIIKPNQKVTIYKNELLAKPKNAVDKVPQLKADVKEIAIQDIKSDANDEILDIVWKENKLAIVDQDFNELKATLERWYNVNITLHGENIGHYRFTATFRDENIDQALKALQKVEPFNYEIHGKNVTILEK